MVTLPRTSRRFVAVEGAPPLRHGVAARPLAFLFTDLESSTALFERVGDIDACEIVREHFEFLEAIVLDHNGMVVKTTGDGVLAAFRSWVDAVRSALAVQTNIADFNRTHAAGDAAPSRRNQARRPCGLQRQARAPEPVRLFRLDREPGGTAAQRKPRWRRRVERCRCRASGCQAAARRAADPRGKPAPQGLRSAHSPRTSTTATLRGRRPC